MFVHFNCNYHKQIHLRLDDVELLINKFKILVSVHPNALIPITVSTTEEV